MTDPLTAAQSIRPAMEASGETQQQVIELCRANFRKSKFSDLSEGQKWTLVALLDPKATGPFGHSMEPF